MSGPSNQDLWGAYLSQIATSQGISPDQCILVGTSTPASFYVSSTTMSPAPTQQAANYQMFLVGDSLLLPSGMCSPAEVSFFSQYDAYINALQPGTGAPVTPSQQTQITTLQQQASAAMAQTSTDMSTAFAAWGQYNVMYPGMYPTFAAFAAGTSYGSVLTNDNDNVLGICSKQSTLYTSIYGADYQQIEGDASAVNQIFTATLSSSVATAPNEMLCSASGGGSTFVEPTYNADFTSFSVWLDGIVSGTGANPISVTLSSATSAESYSQSSYFSQTSWSEDFFFYTKSESSSSGGSSVTIDTSSSAFSVEVKLKGTYSLSVDAGSWYQSALMTGWSNPSQLVQVTSMLIGIVDTITVTYGSVTDYQAATSAYTSSGYGVGIFFGASNKSSSSGTQSSTFNFQETSSGGTLTITSTSNVPVILAYNVNMLPNSTTANFT